MRTARRWTGASAIAARRSRRVAPARTQARASLTPDGGAMTGTSVCAAIRAASATHPRDPVHRRPP